VSETSIGWGVSTCARCFRRAPLLSFSLIGGEPYCATCEPTQGERRAERKLAAAQKAYDKFRGNVYLDPQQKRESWAAWEAVKRAHAELEKQHVLGKAKRAELRRERGEEPLKVDAP
jgi:hypothetical protein